MHYSLDFSSITKINYRAAVTFAEGIESQNVVGYATKKFESGFTSFTPMFIEVGGEKHITAKDITGDIPEMDSIQIFGNGGDVDTELFYLVNGSITEGATGWYYDDFSTPAGDKILVAGNEFWYNAGDVANITVSGQVNADPVTVTLKAGFTPTGNCSAKDLKVSEFVFSNINEMDSIQIFGNGGDVETELFYLVKGSITEGETGWYYDDFSTPAGDKDIAAGTGFWVNCASEGGSITIPSAL